MPETDLALIEQRIYTIRGVRVILDSDLAALYVVPTITVERTISPQPEAVSRGLRVSAYRGRSKAEFVSKCGDCLREIEETAYWLDLLADAACRDSREAEEPAPGMQ
jgi:hypothetical protein